MDTLALKVHEPTLEKKRPSSVLGSRLVPTTVVVGQPVKDDTKPEMPGRVPFDW